MSYVGQDVLGAEPLSRTSQGTLHYQVYQALSHMIKSGELRPGDRILTEAELVEAFNVSRTTARRAVDELRREGLVERLPGRGTFVLAPPFSANIPYLHSVTEEIEQLGYKAGIASVTTEEGVADKLTAERLEIAVGDPVLVVSRIRTADDKPVYTGTSRLNIQRFPQLIGSDFSSTGLYPLFEATTGLRIARAVQWLSAVPASVDVAKQLHVRPAAPVLQLERVVYLEDGHPIEAVAGYFHGRIYKHYTETLRDPNEHFI